MSQYLKKSSNDEEPEPPGSAGSAVLPEHLRFRLSRSEQRLHDTSTSHPETELSEFERDVVRVMQKSDGIIRRNEAMRRKLEHIEQKLLELEAKVRFIRTLPLGDNA